MSFLKKNYFYHSYWGTKVTKLLLWKHKKHNQIIIIIKNKPQTNDNNNNNNFIFKLFRISC